MTYTRASIQEFLGSLPGLRDLSANRLATLAEQLQPWRYRMGQKIIGRENLPGQVAILYEGQVRLLGYDPTTQLPVTLELLRPGALIGAVSLLRGVACETAIASTEAICLTFSQRQFVAFLEVEPALAEVWRDRSTTAEIFDLLVNDYQSQAQPVENLKEFARQLAARSQVRYLSSQQTGLPAFLQNDQFCWFVSGGIPLRRYGLGSRLPRILSEVDLTLMDDRAGESASPPLTRLVGIPLDGLQETVGGRTIVAPLLTAETVPAEIAIPYASDALSSSMAESPLRSSDGSKPYPLLRAKGTKETTLACFQMLAQYLGLPFRREVMRRILDTYLRGQSEVSLAVCGGLVEFMGLTAQLATVPAEAISRLPSTALVPWQGSLGVIYEVSPREVVLAAPEQGLLRLKPAHFARQWGESGQLLLIQVNRETPQQKFDLSWFLPAIAQHKTVLFEVLLASFFVQLFSLANPLMIQIIIDKVLVQNSIATLQVLGFALLVIAMFEAVLSSLRTYLFTEVTNRIDMTLAAQVIDHLLRLPLRYFDRRPVGELSTRINELENIRQFLTGTALTVVLDSVFSVLYIVVMFFYSWVLTLVALATIPLFAAVTLVTAPIVRRQLRDKAEKNSQTQSHLVEVLSGIQTVKAQNIELRARWQWQDKYAKYISAGFKTVLTFTAASSTSNFLHQLSGLLVLWVGAYLVLKQELTLGQLIAFRIIAGYVTSPLLRLVQLWQNFQETALSFERLSDIVDTPREAETVDRQNIPMPTIRGSITYENLSFRFAASGPMQLDNINLTIPAGQFVGIIGQSGSGKSTLMKLLPRLYEANSGRVLIDGYDIAKVELYSLRSQVGIIPQDTLLFDGTIQDNIALTVPDATSEEIIQAARLAVAHEFIMGLPAGYNTRVGERGTSLSGGQRQRIAIARTILQNPRMLILDEATSALDYDTERQVCQNLLSTFRGRTILFITHRLATVQAADLILVMDKGVIAEQGTHTELMALRGRYYCLFQQQQALAV